MNRSVPLTNAAVEWQRTAFERLNSLDHPPDGFAATEDFVYEDHRSGGVNFGRLDASGWSDFLRSVWTVGPGQPHRSIREVIAVREQRSAAMVVHIDFGNEMVNEFINCVWLDEGLERLRRVAHYDVSDATAAIDDLDRTHANG